MKGTKSKGTWSFRTKLGFPSFFISCCIFFFFAGFYGSMLLSHDISSDGGGMAGPRLLESVEEGSQVPVPMAYGETGDSYLISIPFQVLSWQPRALYFPNFATTKQCQSIIKIAKANLAPSTLALRKGETAENTQGIRTSSGTFISASEDKTGVLEFIEKKIARATMVPRSHGEAFNVLRYEIGQRYDSHYDAFNPAEYGPQKSQRIASFLLYLSDVEEGGETMFPFENGLNMDNSYDYKACVGLKVKPRQGDGLLFYSVFPNGTIDQVLPVPFRMPFERADKVRKACYNCSKSFKELIAVWDVGQKMVQKHEIIFVSMCHSEHFRVILEYPNARRWNYYNSMPQDPRLEKVKCGECSFTKDFV